VFLAGHEIAVRAWTAEERFFNGLPEPSTGLDPTDTGKLATPDPGYNEGCANPAF